jgi:hypothetical protein
LLCGAVTGVEEAEKEWFPQVRKAMGRKQLTE